MNTTLGDNPFRIRVPSNLDGLEVHLRDLR
jgi:hypothetical protein